MDKDTAFRLTQRILDERAEVLCLFALAEDRYMLSVRMADGQSYMIRSVEDWEAVAADTRNAIK